MTNETDPTYAEISDALVNATRVIAAQAMELVTLKEAANNFSEAISLHQKATESYKEVVLILEKENKELLLKTIDLKREHIATTKAVRQKAVAYLDEKGNVVLIGEESMLKSVWISGRDRMVDDRWKPLGIIPKIDETEV